MGEKVLIDTNVAIGYFANRLNIGTMDQIDEQLDKEYHLSVINKIELLGYPGLTRQEEKFNLFIDNSIMHPIDDRIIEKTINIRKRNKIKLPDAIIAATCLIYGLSLLTQNSKDFEKIPDLKVLSYP